MTAVQDDFDFYAIGPGDKDFGGYFSDPDPTDLDPNLMVQGSKNVYKRTRGNISVRPGLKRFGPSDDSLNGVVASYEWTTSFAETRIIRVLADGQFQIKEGDDTWLTIGEFDETRFVFTTWWSDTAQQELLVMVNGENAIHSWTGGVIEEVGGVNSAGVMGYGVSPTTSLTAEVIVGGTRIFAANNQQSSSSARAAFVFASNPQASDSVSYAIASDGLFKSGTASIQFVSAITGSPSTSFTQVLIGATKEETASNLLGFFSSPSTTTAGHRAITGTDLIEAIGYSAYSTVNSLETGDGETWISKGFTDGYPSVGSSITVDGTSYTYTLVVDKYLVNISGIPTQGEFGYQSIATTADKPVDDFNADFCAVINNQVIIGSYTSPVVYFSADTNYLDFTNSGDLISGDPDQIILDELPRGVIVVNESAYIPAGSGAWYICTPNTPVPLAQPLTSGNDRLVIIKVVKKVGAAKSAALAHEFLGALSDTIVYLGQDHQVRMFGVFKDLIGTKYPSISQAIRQELIDTDFTGGCLRAVEDKIYLVAPVPGITFMYQERDDVDEAGNVVAERIWHAPFDWNISRIAIINDIEYGYSNQSPETYQLWDTEQWHDDTPSGVMPYPCVLRLSYWQFKIRTKKGDLDKVYLEGYMPANADLTCTLRADYLGATAIEDKVVSALNDTPALYTENGPVIGGALIGQEIIGGGTRQPGIPKFRAIVPFKKHECFEYQIELSSYALDSEWEIICVGSNGSQVINNPVEIIKS